MNFKLGNENMQNELINMTRAFGRVMGSTPVGDSHFFFVPRSCHVDQFTFHNLVLLYVTRTSKVRVTIDSRMGYVTQEVLES